MSASPSAVNPFQQWRHGARWRRFVALFLDVGVLAAGFGALWLLFLPLRLYALAEGEHEAYTLLVALVPAFLYFPLMESSPLQATLGKRAMGLIVTDVRGRRVSYFRAVGRCLTRVIACGCFACGGLLYLPFLLSKYEADRQVFHDQLAGTLVLDGRAGVAVPLPTLDGRPAGPADGITPDGRPGR